VRTVPIQKTKSLSGLEPTNSFQSTYACHPKIYNSTARFIFGSSARDHKILSESPFYQEKLSFEQKPTKLLLRGMRLGADFVLFLFT
jgi:hypothetical protein